MTKIVWLATQNANILIALYPNSNGLIPVGYAIETNGKFTAASYNEPQKLSHPFSTKTEASDYIVKLSRL